MRSAACRVSCRVACCNNRELRANHNTYLTSNPMIDGLAAKAERLFMRHVERQQTHSSVLCREHGVSRASVCGFSVFTGFGGWL